MLETEIKPAYLQAVDLPNVAKAKEITEAEVNAAIEILKSRLNRLIELDGTVRVDFDAAATRSVFVDCRSGSIIEPCETKGILVAHPSDLIRVMNGHLDPRSAMLFMVLQVGGDIPTVTRFCDRLAGNRSETYMKGRPSLPTPTTDWELGRRQIEQFGYCLIKDALSLEQVEALQQRLEEQAEAERQTGVAWFEGHAGHDDGPTQRVWCLQNKGDVFLNLLKHPLIDYFVRPMLDDYYQISNFLALMAGPGNEPQQLHTDQVGVQPHIKDFPISTNILWFLDDICDENGGTRVFPGSHHVAVGPDNIWVSDGTVAAEGPKGTALVFDPRLWHGTGMNRTDKNRRVLISLFYRSWLRPQINPWTSIHPDVQAKFDEHLKILHGWRCTSTHGGREDQIEGEFNGYEPDVLVREMNPKKSG